MLRVYQTGGDIHDDMALRIFGPEALQDSHYHCGDGRLDKRQWAKTINFLVLYRGGWEKLQATLLGDCGVLLPDKVCQEIAWSMPDKRPGLWAWQEALVATARSQGYIEVPFTGQSRWFMNQGRQNEDWDENEIVNMPVQTIAGTVLLQIQAELHRRLPHLNTLDPDILMCHQVYDSIMLDCRSYVAVTRAQDLLGEAVAEVRDHGYWHLLEQHYGRQVPLVLDTKVAKSRAA